MKKFIIIFIAFISIFTNNNVLAQGEYKVGCGIGFNSIGDIPISFDISLSKIYINCTFYIGGESYNVLGRDYTGTINPNEYMAVEDYKSDGYMKGELWSFGIGYNMTEYLTLGVSIGEYYKTNYINCYDKYHILSNSGYYCIANGGYTNWQLGGFINLNCPLDSWTPFVSISYQQSSGFGVLIGAYLHLDAIMGY